MRIAASIILIHAFVVLPFAGGDERADFFEANIRPVLVEHCYGCHSQDAEKVGGELLLDSSASLLRGGESGQAVEPGDAGGSLLMEAIRYEGLEMPPKGKLPDRVIADFERWINNGAFDSRTEQAVTAKHKPQAGIDFESRREFWAFQRPTTHRLPAVWQTNWPKRRHDHFVLSRLEQNGLAPSQQADRRTLIRRLSYDVTGLPPTANEVAEFVADTNPDAYQQLVERKLDSPQFGARWARLWLDVARYAEDQAHIVGNNKALFYPNAWRYRDWVIEAFNRDMPYDQFVRLQLAADLMGTEGEPHIAALGFLGLGPKYYRRNAPEVMADEWEDRVDTVSRGLLGITVACARCHDHKFDPIATEDYYALAGVFASTEMYNRPPADWKPTKKQKKPDPSITLHVLRDAKPRDLKVHIRGDAFNQGNVVPRRFVQILADEEVPLQDGSGRIPLSNAIASPTNPLTARVIVNRIWGEYFGRPLVATPSNFGELGGRPTHPRLLDDLAVEFMSSGWSLKWLHREIVMSATYRQASSSRAALREADPENQLLGRMSRRRLSIEMWRDGMLSASGNLDKTVGGTSIDLQDTKSNRRTVYSQVSRLELDSMLQLFDYPDPNVHAASRAETTTPLQKLFTLNSEFVVQRAEQLAERLKRQADTPGARLELAYQTLFARSPDEAERKLALQFLGNAPNSDQWTQYAQILLASNEMMYRD